MSISKRYTIWIMLDDYKRSDVTYKAKKVFTTDDKEEIEKFYKEVLKKLNLPQS